ncbi:MAG TPA: toll/interleukin-1 receptor domain-containing protein [Aggregatilineales bacterium]|nr:toll/interleukin-1 receptor domain-containing protein [Aggregatilineales bacterium]
MNSSIFISYRRDDSSGHALKIFETLRDHFGEENIFFDKNNLEMGASWDVKIQTELQNCEILIAVIGNKWLNSRIFELDDYVRLEISTALKRGVGLIPVLVDGASFPLLSQIPDDLHSLTKRQALWISDKGIKNYNYDLSQLVTEVKRKISRTSILKIHRTVRSTPALVPWEIFISGKSYGTLISGQSKEIEVPIGQHQIYVEQSAGLLASAKKSIPLSFTFTPNLTVSLICGTNYKNIVGALFPINTELFLKKE